MKPTPAKTTLIPYTTLFRSDRSATATASASAQTAVIGISQPNVSAAAAPDAALATSPSTAFTANTATTRDRKSTRLNSSHPSISYAVFCLKKKKKNLHG